MKSSKAEVQNRRDKLLDYIISKESTSIEELALFFSVSSITIRRDVEEFRNNDQVELRNGIVTINPHYKRLLKDNHHALERKAIQMRAAKLVEEGDVIFINTSYTALGILEYIEDKFCTVVTNNTHILDLSLGSNIVPILAGGEIRQPRSSLSGEFTIETLRRVHATKCFIGVDGISFERGSIVGGGGELSCAVHHEAIINGVMLNSCIGKKYVVVTSERLNRSDRFSCGNLSMVDAIITDHRADNFVITELKSRGIEVILV